MLMSLRKLGFTTFTVALMALAACGGSSSQGNGGSSTTPTNIPVPPLGADQILAKAKVTMPKAVTFNSNSTTVLNGATTTLKQQVSFITTPYETDFKITTTNAGQTATIETITTDTASYTNVGGQWIKGPVRTKLPISQVDEGHAALDLVATATLAGTEPVNGVSTYHLTSTITDPTSKATDSFDVWIRTDNFYIVKETAKGSGNSASDSNDLTYTAWDDQVKITLPNV